MSKRFRYTVRLEDLEKESDTIFMISATDNPKRESLLPSDEAFEGQPIRMTVTDSSIDWEKKAYICDAGCNEVTDKAEIEESLQTLYATDPSGWRLTCVDVHFDTIVFTIANLSMIDEYEGIRDIFLNISDAKFNVSFDVEQNGTPERYNICVHNGAHSKTSVIKIAEYRNNRPYRHYEFEGKEARDKFGLPIYLSAVCHITEYWTHRPPPQYMLRRFE